VVKGGWTEEAARTEEAGQDRWARKMGVEEKRAERACGTGEGADWRRAAGGMGGGRGDEEGADAGDC